MSDDLRMRCLELAARLPWLQTADEVIKAAETMHAFVIFGRERYEGSFTDQHRDMRKELGL